MRQPSASAPAKRLAMPRMPGASAASIVRHSGSLNSLAGAVRPTSTSALACSSSIAKPISASASLARANTSAGGPSNRRTP